MNLVQATVEGSMLRASSFALPLPFPIADGRRVVVGIRPEHLEHQPAGEDAGGSIRAVVDMVEPIGHESIVYATAGGEKLVAIFEPHEAPRTGATVSFTVDPARVHLFDAATELAI